MNTNTNTNTNKFIIIIFIIISLYCSYGVVTQSSYLFHDDYYYLLVGNRGCSNHPQYTAYLNDYGRPFGIFIKCLEASLFYAPQDAILVRMIILLVIIFTNFLLFNQLNHEIKSPLLSALLAISIFTLLPFQPVAAMLANSTHVFSVLSALISSSIILNNN